MGPRAQAGAGTQPRSPSQSSAPRAVPAALPTTLPLGLAAGRGQEKAPGKRRAWRSLSACSRQPLGAADSQLDSGRGARANVTSPGGELSSQWGSGWEWGCGGGGGPERGIPSQSLIPARPLLLLPVPAPPAGPGIGFGAGYTSKAISSSRQAGEALLHSELAFPEPPAVPQAGLPAPVVRDQRWASREEPSAKGRPPRIRPAAAGSGTCPGPRGGHLSSRGRRVKAWAGKGREVGTFEAGSPWKSHGSQQEPPGDPQSSAVSIRGPRSPEDTGPLESPHLVQQALALRPPSRLSWASSSCSVLRGVGAPPPRLPYSCQSPAVQTHTAQASRAGSRKRAPTARAASGCKSCRPRRPRRWPLQTTPRRELREAGG
uniref:Uncharacterized protein n=1 Tax=Rangifer tarandus platyrhynchus TaxID=3082113 RepID=A0ACB0EWF7_RANTA|nr:unnamed protein product [Rangifer tarandus platyrhynchus]